MSVAHARLPCDCTSHGPFSSTESGWDEQAPVCALGSGRPGSVDAKGWWESPGGLIREALGWPGAGCGWRLGAVWTERCPGRVRVGLRRRRRSRLPVEMRLGRSASWREGQRLGGEVEWLQDPADDPTVAEQCDELARSAAAWAGERSGGQRRAPRARPRVGVGWRDEGACREWVLGPWARRGRATARRVRGHRDR